MFANVGDLEYWLILKNYKRLQNEDKLNDFIQ